MGIEVVGKFAETYAVKRNPVKSTDFGSNMAQITVNSCFTAHTQTQKRYNRGKAGEVTAYVGESHVLRLPESIRISNQFEKGQIERESSRCYTFPVADLGDPLMATCCV